MVKKKVVDTAAAPAVVQQVQPPDTNIPPGLLWDLSVLMYCSFTGKTVDDHKGLSPAEQDTWYQYAIAAIIGLDKLNKMIVVKVLPEVAADRRRKNIDIFTARTKEFFSRLKRIHPDMFPYEEFAIWFLEGERNAPAN